MPLPSRGSCEEAGKGSGWGKDEPDGGEIGVQCGAVETVDGGRDVGGPGATDEVTGCDAYHAEDRRGGDCPVSGNCRELGEEVAPAGSFGCLGEDARWFLRPSPSRGCLLRMQCMA